MMYPDAGEVLHFSEDPTITAFVPRGEYVWAVDSARASDYWFPRQCPRVLAWVTPSTTAADRALLGAQRVHAIAPDWLARMSTTDLYAYRLPAAQFRPIGEYRHALVATATVVPLREPELIGDLAALHADAGIELRVVADLAALVEAWYPTTLGLSAIRMPR
jgi:hypothetical protein